MRRQAWLGRLGFHTCPRTVGVFQQFTVEPWYVFSSRPFPSSRGAAGVDVSTTSRATSCSRRALENRSAFESNASPARGSIDLARGFDD